MCEEQDALAEPKDVDEQTFVQVLRNVVRAAHEPACHW
jgi:hypothetical protein